MKIIDINNVNIIIKIVFHDLIFLFINKKNPVTILARDDIFILEYCATVKLRQRKNSRINHLRAGTRITKCALFNPGSTG